MRFKFARRPTTGRAHVCAEREDRGVSADHIRQDAARQAQVLSISRPPGIGIAANFDRRLKTGRTSTKCLESEGSRRQAPDRPQSSCWRRGASRPYGLALQARWGSRKRRLHLKRGGSRQIKRILQFLQCRGPSGSHSSAGRPEQRARLGSTRNDRHVWSVPDLCARRSDRLLAGQSAKVIPAASYRHAPLDVARPQPDVVPAEWPHGAAHSESRP
jgi:hypothetical protein